MTPQVNVTFVDQSTSSLHCKRLFLLGAKGVDLSTDSNVDYSGLSWYIYLTLYMYVRNNKRKDKIAKADRIIMICCGTILYKLSMHGSNI